MTEARSKSAARSSPPSPVPWPPAALAKGVRVIFEADDTVSIELHIIVDAGVNLTAVSSSIMSEVRYAVGQMTGAQVRAVDVYVDSMQID